MRPNGRWWIFISAMAIAWGGWWWLERRQPGPDVERPSQYGDSPELAARSAPPSPEPPDPADTAEPDRPPDQRDLGMLFDSVQPAAPQEPGPEPGAPRPLPGLEDLSLVGQAPPAPSGSIEGNDAGGPTQGKPSGFDNLPGIDDQLEVASTSVGVDPGLAADIRRGERAQEDGRLADAERQFLAAARKPGSQPARPSRSWPRSTGWRAGSMRCASWRSSSGARPIAPGRIARRRPCSSSSWR